MDEKTLMGIASVLATAVALGVLGRISPRLFWPVDWLPRWSWFEKKPQAAKDWWLAQWDIPPVPPAPAEPELPESGVAIVRHKILCDCQYGCKSGECAK
jgi:hypothetical protein